ncbi:MAG: hypothetical protein H6Q19_1636 [Bacteroidetes bacterium]|nr:hypothetical protein [Bacteroidota bacterium]
MPHELQNIACFEITVPTGTNIISLGHVNLNDRLIQSVYLFSSTEDVMLFSPVSGKQVSALAETGPCAIYLNLTDSDNEQFVRDYSSGNFTIYSEMDHFVSWRINRKIDWKQSFLKTIIPDKASTLNLLMYIAFENVASMVLSGNVVAEKTVNLTPDNDIQDFYLDTFFPELTDKTITGINVSNQCNGYFDLHGQNNRLENVPAHFFAIKSSKGFQIAPMKIDLKKTCYLHRSFSRESFSITLSYLP